MKRGGRWTYTVVCVMMAIGRFEMEFGPEIKVDGVRPEWLGTGDMFEAFTGRNWIVGPDHLRYTPLEWGVVMAIRLPANHTHYHQDTPTPDERAVAHELVERMRKLVERMAAQTVVDEMLMDEARAIVAAFEPADRIEARRIARIWEIDDEAAYQILARGRQLERDTRDVTPCTRAQFESECG